MILRVEDSGVGVPDHLRDRLFDPFVTSKEAGIGTGLGLSISAGLIRAMGGRIALDPTPSRHGGAAFTITLPRDTTDARPCNSEAGAPMTPSPSLNAEPVAVHTALGEAAMVDEDDNEEASALVAHVLVADDETEAANLMADFLRTRGHRVSSPMTG